jgi:peptidoglycan hydrolase CwlO-like protein
MIKNQHFAILFVAFFVMALNPQIVAQSTVNANGENPLPAVDSLATMRFMLNEERTKVAVLSQQLDSVHGQIKSLSGNLERLKQRESELVPLNEALNLKIVELGAELHSKNNFLEEQLRIQKEKEQLFAEKEQLYKDAVNSSMIDKVKLEGQISAKDSRLDGKEREIGLLQLSIDEKNRDILTRNSEIQKIISDKDMADRRIDTLRSTLTEAEKSLVRTGEQLKYTELKLKDCEGRYANVTNKKKKTRVVQGFAIKNYRTPDFALAPKDANNPGVYVITNKNTSNIEFDFVTGASFMLKDLSKPNAALTYDVGFFLGFGGNNLFKNFYLGPNFKLFDVLHVNLGANVREYEALKEGFNVGDRLDAGIAIPTTKEWKIKPYLGLTFDLELLTMIGKR